MPKAKTTDIVTLERVRELLAYDPATGDFTWRITRGKMNAGEPAGSIWKIGYRFIGIDSRSYLAHRLAWLLMTGAWPTQNIDHINGDRADNRFSNLRDVSQALNVQNQRKPHVDKKSCRLIGATWDKANRNWKAQVIFKKRTVYSARFETAEAAHAAYVEAKRRIHAGCTL